MEVRNRLTIAIDCDDVLLDTIKTFLEEYEKRYGVAVPPSMCYSKDPSVWGVEDYSEALKRQYEIFSEVEFPPIPSSQEVLSRLSKNHDLWVLTGRHEDMAEMTQVSIDKYFPNIFTGIRFTGFLQGDNITKGLVCREIGAQVMVDDLPTHIESVIDEGGLREAIVFGDYPWNKDQKLGSVAVQCLDWLSVESEITRIASNGK